MMSTASSFSFLLIPAHPHTVFSTLLPILHLLKHFFPFSLHTSLFTTLALRLQGTSPASITAHKHRNKEEHTKRYRQTSCPLTNTARPPGLPSPTRAAHPDLPLAPRLRAPLPEPTRPAPTATQTLVSLYLSQSPLSQANLFFLQPMELPTSDEPTPIRRSTTTVADPATKVTLLPATAHPPAVVANMGSPGY